MGPKCQGAAAKHWLAERQGEVLPVPCFHVVFTLLSRLFRRLFLEKLRAAHREGRLRFFNHLAHLGACDAFAAYLAPWHDADWVVYAKARTRGGLRPLSPDPRLCLLTSPAIPTASPSRTAASSASTARASPSRASPSRGRTIAQKQPFSFWHEQSDDWVFAGADNS